MIGSTICGPDQQPFVPHGLNVGTKNDFNANGAAEGHTADIAAWGANTYRPTIACTNRSTWSTRYVEGYAALRKTVDQLVKEATARHLVVVLTCFDPWSSYWGTGGTATRTTKTRAKGVADADAGKSFNAQYLQYWDDNARLYGTNPYVWFDFANEPSMSTVADWWAFYGPMTDRVRAAGARNVVTPEAFRLAADTCDNVPRLADPQVGPAFSATHTGVVYQVHAYGMCAGQAQGPNADDPTSPQAVQQALFARNAAAGIPWFIGEYGYALSLGAPEARNTAESLMVLGPRYHVGLLTWHATGNDNLGLKSVLSSGKTYQVEKGFYYGGSNTTNLTLLGCQTWYYNHAPDVGAADAATSVTPACQSAFLSTYGSFAVDPPTPTSTPSPVPTPTVTPTPDPSPPTPDPTAPTLDPSVPAVTPSTGPTDPVPPVDTSSTMTSTVTQPVPSG